MLQEKQTLMEGTVSTQNIIVKDGIKTFIVLQLLYVQQRS